MAKIAHSQKSSWTRSNVNIVMLAQIIDLTTPISRFAKQVKKNSWPWELQVALIGSCTNSSYEDMSCSSLITKQAADLGLEVRSKLLVVIK
jgi:aconitase A